MQAQCLKQYHRHEFDSPINHRFLVAISAMVMNKFNKMPLYTKNGGYFIPPLGPVVVAANTPPEHEVLFIDDGTV